MAPGVVENTFCGLLSNEENLQVFKLLGNRCQSLCSTVVQLYQTQPPSHSQWIKTTTGVLCFVKDNVKKNFFFRLFCLKKNMKVWEHEMYNNMDYIEGTPFFHMFEAEECMVAFNFASIEEARDLRIVVHQKIQARKRREDKRSRQISQSQTLPSPTTQVKLYGHKKTLGPVDKQSRRRIIKEEIGLPNNFRHISHVGWNSASGFDIDTEDEQLRTFFIKAGVSEKQLQDKSTRDYIYDFINRNGVREAIVQETKKTEDNIPPTVPPRAPSSRPPHFRNAPPPPIPTKTNNGSITLQKPKMNVAPPKKPAPLPISAPSAPPPPPPPPPPPVPLENVEKVERIGNVIPPPTPPTTAPHSPRIDISEGNAELMQSIKNGIILKPVEEQPLPSPHEDSRNDLLLQIQKGIQLRPIDERDIKPVSSPVLKRTNDLAEILKERIAQRSRAIHSEDDDESSESADSDWDCD